MDHASQAFHKDESIESLLEFESIVNLEFSSEEEAGVFFNSYAKQKGFSARKDVVRKMKKVGDVYFRTFLCHKAGYRSEKYLNLEDRKINDRAETRCGCPVKFSVKLNRKTGNWYVHDFYEVHNHELTDSEEVLSLWSHRVIDDVEKDDIEAFEMDGLRKKQIMRVMERVNGGYKHVGFLKKDLYNFSARRKKARVLQGDAERVLQLMHSRYEADSDFYFDYDTDKDGCLNALFWSDAQSIIDYDCFGDVLVFDSTYCVNRYNMSFVPFVGVNHHASTIVFGCGIVANECSESYEWLLKTFLCAMSQKFPKSVITDGCPSMAKAIRTVFKDQTQHRLCSWHVERNMARYLHHSKIERFRSILYRSRDPMDFEKKWNELVGDCSVLNDEDEVVANTKMVNWLNSMYDSKERWASGFLQGKLLLGMRSNQRSESLNSILQAHLDRRMYLFELVAHYERCLMNFRRTEIELDCKASQSTPVAKTMFKVLEKHAATIYTEKIFYRVQEEMKRIGDYTIVETVDTHHYRMLVMELKAVEGKRTAVEYYVDDKNETKKIVCECMKLDCELIPCRHILTVLVETGVNAIPECCVQRRWTKRPKLRLPLPSSDILFDWSKESERKKILTHLGKQVFHEASKSDEGFASTFELLQQAKLYLRDVVKTEVDIDQGDSCKDDTYSFGVADPRISVRRGAPKKNKKSFMDVRSYKCSKCHKSGHNKAKCPIIDNHDRHVDNDGDTLLTSDGEETMLGA